LVLHNDRAPRSYAHDSELASTWQPPATNERLSVVPLPDAPAAKKPAAAAAPAPSPEPVEDLYLRGLDLLRRHEFAEAQREFDAFVSARPRDPRVGKAHFFRAELAYAERDYKRALAAYEQSLSADPLGDKAPDAMLRSALCQLSLGAREKARAILNSLRAKFPDSEAARKSAQVMQEDSG
jgi:tol-pal system protein YbgF